MKGFVLFGSNVHKQSSRIFMGTSPGQELANDFAFMHEFISLNVMKNEFEHATNNGN